jgi:hypothetical protein
MKKQLTPFERYMRNQLKKEKDIQDQRVLDEMLQELKAKHEKERREKREKLEMELEKLK